MRQSHGQSHTNLDSAKFTVRPQTVFACGFENCIQIFESPSDAEAPASLKGLLRTCSGMSMKCPVAGNGTIRQ